MMQARYFLAVLIGASIMGGCGSKEVSTTQVDMSQVDTEEFVHMVARSGDLNKLQELLQTNPNLAYARSMRNRNLLHTAAASGQDQVVSYLLQMGFNPNEPDDQDSYAIEMALEAGHTSTVRLLQQSLGGGGAQ